MFRRWIENFTKPPFVGELANGKRVYSNVAVKSASPEEIIFTNGSVVSTHHEQVSGGRFYITQVDGSTFNLH